MFETLSSKLTSSLRKVRGQGRMTEENIRETLGEVKTALLEADVNFRVVKAFLRAVQERAVGEGLLLRRSEVGPPLHFRLVRPLHVARDQGHWSSLLLCECGLNAEPFREGHRPQHLSILAVSV